MTNDQAILNVVGAAMALIHSEDALDRRWTPECAAVVEARTAEYVRKVKNLTGHTQSGMTLVPTIMVLARSILREVDHAQFRSACEEIAEMLD